MEFISETMVKVDSLQGKVKTGYLVKLGLETKNWKKRLFVLLNSGVMYYYKTNQDPRPLGYILLSGVTVTTILKKRKLCISISHPHRREYFLHCSEKKEEMFSWIDEIQKIVDSLEATKKTKREEYISLFFGSKDIVKWPAFVSRLNKVLKEPIEFVHEKRLRYLLLSLNTDPSSQIDYISKKEVEIFLDTFGPIEECYSKLGFFIISFHGFSSKERVEKVLISKIKNTYAFWMTYDLQLMLSRIHSNLYCWHYPVRYEPILKRWYLDFFNHNKNLYSTIDEILGERPDEFEHPFLSSFEKVSAKWSQQDPRDSEADVLLRKAVEDLKLYDIDSKGGLGGRIVRESVAEAEDEVIDIEKESKKHHTGLTPSINISSVTVTEGSHAPPPSLAPQSQLLTQNLSEDELKRISTIYYAQKPSSNDGEDHSYVVRYYYEHEGANARSHKCIIQTETKGKMTYKDIIRLLEENQVGSVTRVEWKYKGDDDWSLVKPDSVIKIDFTNVSPEIRSQYDIDLLLTKASSVVIDPVPIIEVSQPRRKRSISMSGQNRPLSVSASSPPVSSHDDSSIVRQSSSKSKSRQKLHQSAKAKTERSKKSTETDD